LPLLLYFPVTYLLLSSLYILCSRWPSKRGRAGSGSGPKPAVYTTYKSKVSYADPGKPDLEKQLKPDKDRTCRRGALAVWSGRAKPDAGYGL